MKPLSSLKAQIVKALPSFKEPPGDHGRCRDCLVRSKSLLDADFDPFKAILDEEVCLEVSLVSDEDKGIIIDKVFIKNMIHNHFIGIC